MDCSGGCQKTAHAVVERASVHPGYNPAGFRHQAVCPPSLPLWGSWRQSRLMRSRRSDQAFPLLVRGRCPSAHTGADEVYLKVAMQSGIFNIFGLVSRPIERRLLNLLNSFFITLDSSIGRFADNLFQNPDDFSATYCLTSNR